jgi:hypothetical protein
MLALLSFTVCGSSPCVASVLDQFHFNKVWLTLAQSTDC